MIKTIIFDLSEVYLQGLLGTHKKLSKKLRTKVKLEDLEVPEMQKLFEGRVTEKEYWRAVLSKNNWSLKITELKEVVRENFNEINGTRKIIEELKKNGYKLGLLSTHAKEWIKHCENKFRYHKLFDSVMYSFEVAICKPDKRIYKFILEKLKAEPANCLFIDDDSQNLKTASDLGMHIILFKSSKQLLLELKRLGIVN